MRCSGTWANTITWSQNLSRREQALEAKYQKLYEPLYTKRYEIVNGIVEVDGVSNEIAMDQGGKTTEDKGVPEFWLNAMKTNEVLAEEISERDEGALKYLKDIKWCRIEISNGVKLDFFFDPNPLKILS
ncbi:Nucleosome assembly protein (NAP) [Parasponia andersonii]|uniref:Nucleosome assembly protein (NAP) n=1 Tax=Parasponia andersonii TaxID=3476 RepID=A0A2P5BH82_PARAD|nr:Nucleosome assembly protein (NAP) [Parasponia andersonii]